jgi:hypothetical protein
MGISLTDLSPRTRAAIGEAIAVKPVRRNRGSVKAVTTDAQTREGGR